MDWSDDESMLDLLHLYGAVQSTDVQKVKELLQQHPKDAEYFKDALFALLDEYKKSKITRDSKKWKELFEYFLNHPLFNVYATHPLHSLDVLGWSLSPYGSYDGNGLSPQLIARIIDKMKGTADRPYTLNYMNGGNGNDNPETYDPMRSLSGKTPLQMAMEIEDETRKHDLMKLLIENGADPNYLVHFYLRQPYVIYQEEPLGNQTLLVYGLSGNASLT